jgi:predicted DNA-binding transcriptional regulator AlpA
MNGPVDIPTIEQLIADPAKAATLPPETAQVILIGLASIHPVLLQRALKGPDAIPATPEKFLTVQQVVARFAVSKQWLYRHKGQLPHSQPSRKVLLFPESRLCKWFANKKTG